MQNFNESTFKNYQASKCILFLNLNENAMCLKVSSEHKGLTKKYDRYVIAPFIFFFFLPRYMCEICIQE